MIEVATRRRISSCRSTESHRRAVHAFFISEGMPEEKRHAMRDFIDQVRREDIVIVESVRRGLPRMARYDAGQSTRIISAQGPASDKPCPAPGLGPASGSCPGRG